MSPFFQKRLLHYLNQVTNSVGKISSQENYNSPGQNFSLVYENRKSITVLEREVMTEYLEADQSSPYFV
jgi:hypothetical protein